MVRRPAVNRLGVRVALLQIEQHRQPVEVGRYVDVVGPIDALADGDGAAQR